MSLRFSGDFVQQQHSPLLASTSGTKAGGKRPDMVRHTANQGARFISASMWNPVDRRHADCADSAQDAMHNKAI
ncbi:hypothetical protein HNQ59_003504 [Chitinivorax tropicus]|uniref:Uncharacterized protein n=1 Tax=Chitinivorax tropicus TaxID=714531 RepID=A0A840MSN7_9PROT|nr:hypothetical protein [Chitinivorax tropicus]MBB5020187.1 hypothetical protein [Chitinivorax tropicus]